MIVGSDAPRQRVLDFSFERRGDDERVPIERDQLFEAGVSRIRAEPGESLELLFAGFAGEAHSSRKRGVEFGESRTIPVQIQPRQAAAAADPALTPGGSRSQTTTRASANREVRYAVQASPRWSLRFASPPSIGAASLPTTSRRRISALGRPARCNRRSGPDPGNAPQAFGPASDAGHSLLGADFRSASLLPPAPPRRRGRQPSSRQRAPALSCSPQVPAEGR